MKTLVSPTLLLLLFVAVHRSSSFTGQPSKLSQASSASRECSLTAVVDSNKESTAQIVKVRNYQKESTPIGKLIPALLRGSKLIYSYSALLDIVREHDRTLNAETPRTKNGREKTLVDFNSPSLVFHGLNDPPRPNRYLKHDVTAAALLEFAKRNRRFLNDDNGEKKILFENKDDSTPLHFEENLEQLTHINGSIVEFDDQFDSKELVFGITVNRTNKRITVFFRGSVMGGKDWKTNLSVLYKKHRTPKILEAAIKGEKIKFHRGFYHYLFDVGADGKTSKFERIVTILKEEHTKNPDYDLYVCGHSLGGALTVLLSFALASDESSKDFPMPIRAVSFASPQIGNEVYKKSYQALEKAGRLRHLQISNEGDIIPTVPSGFGYSQSGVNLHVYKEKHLKLGYSTSRSVVSQLSFSQGKHHGLDEYDENLLNKQNDDVLAMTMDDLYNEVVKNVGSNK